MNRTHRKNRKNRAGGSTNKRPLSESSSLVFGNLDEEPDFLLPPPEPPPPEPPPPDPSSEPLLPTQANNNLCLLASITTSRSYLKDLQHDLSIMRQQIMLPTFCNLNGTNEHQYLHPSGIFFLCTGTGRGCMEIDPGNAEQAVRAQRIFYHNLDEYRAFHNSPPLTPCPFHSPTNFPLYYPPTYNPCLTFPVYIQPLITEFFFYVLPTYPKKSSNAPSSTHINPLIPSRQSSIHDFFFPTIFPSPSATADHSPTGGTTTNITTFPTFHLHSSSPSATADHSPIGGTTTNITTFPTFHLHSSSPSATVDHSPTGGTTTNITTFPTFHLHSFSPSATADHSPTGGTTTNITTFPTFHLHSSSPSATADHSPTGGTTTNITTFPTFHLHSSSPSATADQSPTGGTTTSFDSNPSSVSIPTVHVQQPTNPRILSYSTSSSDTISSRPPILPTTRPTYAERLSALCSQSNAPFYNLFTLQHAIIELENTFFGLYQYRPEETSGWEYEEFQSFYDLTESDLKSKYRLLESMRTLDIYNPENTNLPYNPSCTYHIYNGRLKPIIYQRTHSPPHIHKSSQWGGQRGVLLEKNEPMLGDGYIQKKKALELKRGGRINIETPVPRNSHIPPPLSQLSDWVRLPSNTHGAHFTPYTAYSLTPSTCQIGFSYCCHNFCLPTQSHNAFTSPFPSTTMHAPKPNIAFFSSLTAKAQPCLPAYNTLPALTSTTYNPSTNPLAVWECSNCWRENFFCLSDNICCTCYKPRFAPNPRAPPRIVYHDPDYFTDDDTATTPPHRYTMFTEPDYSCENEALSWDTVSNFSCEESEWGSVSSVDFPQHIHTIPSISLPSCHMHIHKHMHTQPKPPIISTPVPDTVRATHTLNFLLQRPPPPSTIVKGYRLHVQTTIIPNTPYTLTSQTPAYTPHVTLYACPLVLFVHKHIRLVRTSLALHITLLHNSFVAQSHANLHIAMKFRTIHTQRPVCFARNPSYASSSSSSTCFYATVFLLFYHFLLPFRCFLSCFPHTALVVGIG